MPHASDGEISLMEIGSILLRQRKLLFILATAGMLVGLVFGLTSPRLYVSQATFIPQEGEGSGMSAVAIAASQFGFDVQGGGAGWGPPVYVELLRSRAVLEPIALDSFRVAERGGEVVALADLLEAHGETPAREADQAYRALQSVVEAHEVPSFGAVKFSVTTPWPSVSHTIAERLLSAVNEFNLQKRKSQATAERRFVEARAAESEAALREAEERLKSFLERNRAYNRSPDLLFEQQSLQRQVALRQDLHTTWMKAREEARIREVRNTPVITVLEDPGVAVTPQSRRVVVKAILGLLGGILLAVTIAFLMHFGTRGKVGGTEEAREFFQLMEEATPRFLRRRGSA